MHQRREVLLAEVRVGQGLEREQGTVHAVHRRHRLIHGLRLEVPAGRPPTHPVCPARRAGSIGNALSIRLGKDG